MKKVLDRIYSKMYLKPFWWWLSKHGQSAIQAHPCSGSRKVTKVRLWTVLYFPSHFRTLNASCCECKVEIDLLVLAHVVRWWSPISVRKWQRTVLDSCGGTNGRSQCTDPLTANSSQADNSQTQGSIRGSFDDSVSLARICSWWRCARESLWIDVHAVWVLPDKPTK